MLEGVLTQSIVSKIGAIYLVFLLLSCLSCSMRMSASLTSVERHRQLSTARIAVSSTRVVSASLRIIPLVDDSSSLCIGHHFCMDACLDPPHAVGPSPVGPPVCLHRFPPVSGPLAASTCRGPLLVFTRRVGRFFSGYWSRFGPAKWPQDCPKTWSWRNDGSQETGDN